MSRGIYIFILISLISFQAIIVSTAQTLDLHHGDLLFVTASDSKLSGAINSVTQTAQKTNFTHMAILEKTADNEYYILHAAPGNGVERMPLRKFIDKWTGRSQAIAVYRVYDSMNVNYDTVLQVAKQQLGKPYNFTYIRSDTAYYCADYVWLAYRHAGVFELEPMTFINPKTNAYHKTWKDHYKSLNIDIPEGALGCNPNKMAASQHIYFVQWIAK